MADIRIKDLTTTASSTASDDFIAVDGTTNGTRKLSAFSPTFGGNATVTGTLTVNGVATAGSYLTSAAGLAFPGALSASGYYLYSGSANGLTMYGYGSTYDVYIGNRAGTRALSVAANSTAVSIPDTTASTTTSTGALVVGNGTSGGLGVGGAINAGNNIVSTIASAPNGSEFTGFQTKIGADGSLGPCLVHVGALPSATGGSRYGYVTCYDTGDWRKLYLGGSPGVGPSGGQVLIPATLSSTSTSSGALVVSGGVGVGGSIYAGGDIAIPADRGIYIKQGNPERWTSDGTPTGTSRADIYADSAGAFFIRTGGLTQALTINSSQNATFAGTISAGVGTHSFGTSAGGGVNNFGALLTYFNIRSTSDSDNPIFRIYDGRVNASAFEVNARTGNTLVAGNITTAAPSGGTAAAWKLGTVASVSPTSPNRTIEVDIGGTIYYIHAKTTNN